MRSLVIIFIALFSVPVSAQIQPVQDVGSVDPYGAVRNMQAVEQQRLQNEQTRYQLQQLQQRQQSVESNAELDRLQRELLSLQIQQERLKLAKLQNGETQQNHIQSSDFYVSLTSEQVTGESKICLYSYDSAVYDFAVPSGDKCPSSIKVRK